MQKNIIPLHDNVVLKLKMEETTTQSGILLALAEKEKSSIGIIIEIGSKVEGLKKMTKWFIKVILVAKSL